MAPTAAPDINEFLAERQRQRGGGSPTPKVPDINQFLAQRHPVNVGPLQQKFAQTNTQPPSRLQQANEYRKQQEAKGYGILKGAAKDVWGNNIVQGGVNVARDIWGNITGTPSPDQQAVIDQHVGTNGPPNTAQNKLRQIAAAGAQKAGGFNTLSHAVNLLEDLDKKVGPKPQSEEETKQWLIAHGASAADAEKLKKTGGNTDPLREAITAYKSVDPKKLDQIQNRGLSVVNVIRGVGGASRQVADGLSTPENLALLYAMGEDAIPRMGRMLIDAGFAKDQAIDAVRDFKEGWEAYKRGDVLTATMEWTAGPVNALFAFLTGHHAFEEGSTELAARRALHDQAKETYGKRYGELTPQEQARAAVLAKAKMANQAATKAGAPTPEDAVFNAVIEAGGKAKKPKGYDKRADQGQTKIAPRLTRIDEIGGELPLVTDALSKRIDSRLEPVVAPTPGEFKDARQLLTGVTRDLHQNRVNRELAAIPNPDKTHLAGEPIVLNTPVYSPRERERIQYQNRVDEVHRVIAAERAAEEERQGKMRQLREDAMARAEDNEQESAARAARNGGFSVADRRPAIAQQVVDELGENAANSEAAKLYRNHIAALNQTTEGMGFRDTELAAELIRAKRARGETVSPEENAVLAMQAKREELLATLAKSTPRAQRILDAHNQALDDEAIGNIINLVGREHDLHEAAKTAEEQARQAGVETDSPEERANNADKYAQQAIEARQLEEKLAAQRRAQQAEMEARQAEKKIVPRGAPLPYTIGNATQIHLSDGRDLKARYGAARLSQLILSHDPFSFQWNPVFEPRRLQPRDTSTNTENQNAIIVDSTPENYEPERYTTDNVTAAEGPAVILPDGRVAGGNSRLARLIRRLRAGDAKDVLADLRASFAKFGIDMEGLEDESDPYVPVRVLDDVPEATQDLILLGEDLNRDASMMGFTPEEQGAMSAERLTTDDIDQLANMMENVPGRGSLKDVLRHRGSLILDMLINRGIIPANKRATFITKTGELTSSAVDLFSAAIRAKVFNDADLMATLPDEIAAKVDQTIASNVRLMAAGGDWDIRDYYMDAMRQWKQIDSIRTNLNSIGKATDSIVDKFYDPGKYTGGAGMLTFGEQEIRPKPHPITYALVKAMEETQTALRKAFRDYAEPAEGLQASLLEPPEPYQAFNDSLGKLGGTEVHPADWGTVTPATNEQKAQVDAVLEPEPKPTAEDRGSEMTAPPNVAIATNAMLEAAQNGTVTPENLRAVFQEDPVTGPHADDVMTILGKIIPKANGVSLADFLQQKFAAVYWVNPEDAESGNPLFQRDTAPIWFLKSEQLRQQKMRGPMPGDDILKMLKAGGVKADELKWTGLDEFLKDKKRVTPDELRAYLAENNVTLEEVHKGALAPDLERNLKRTGANYQTAVDQFDANATAAGMSRNWIINARNRAIDGAEMPEPGGEVSDEDWKLLNANFKEMQTASAEYDLYASDASAIRNTKFGKYTLPGGKDYREMLVTLPENRGKPLTAEEQAELTELENKVAADKLSVTSPRFAELYARSRKRTSTPQERAAQFKSSHWDELSILFHVRFNDRTLPDGRRVLHLEELQSDWHQKGRDKGYRGGEDPAAIAAAVKAREDARLAVEEARKVYGKAHSAMMEAWSPDKGQNAELEKAANDAADVVAQRREEFTAADRAVTNLYSGQTGAVPDAPFKKTWHEVALRRMIRYAAENGYDGVSWTPGAKQAERYSLSTVVDKLTYDADDRLKGYKDGRVVNTWYVTEKDLPDYIGKEAARKLLEDQTEEPMAYGYNNTHIVPVEPARPTDPYSFAVAVDKSDRILGTYATHAEAEEARDRGFDGMAPLRTLEGESLNVGGQGMHGFYDKIVPDYLKSYAKKWNAKVEEAGIPIGQEYRGLTYTGPELTVQGMRDVVDWAMRSYSADDRGYFTSSIAWRMESGKSFGEAFADVAKDYGADVEPIGSIADAAKGKLERQYDQKTVKAPFMAVTPEMRRSVLEDGQALFQREKSKKQAVIRGSTEFLADGRAVVRLVRGQANASTLLHEIVHVMRRNLVDPEDIRRLENFAGVENGLWTPKQEEMVTRGFERYLTDGIAPNEEVRGVFARMKEMMRSIYGYLRDGKFRLPKESPINIKLDKGARETFDRWFGEDRRMEPTPETGEPVPPPNSIALDVTPAEREEAVIKFNGANDINLRMSEARAKRFPDINEAAAWSYNNRGNLWSVNGFELPSGAAFVYFVPKDSKVLLQQEPQTLGEMVKRVEQIKKLLETEQRPEVRERMMNDVRRLDAKIGVPEFTFTGPPPESTPKMAPPPDMRPALKPGEVTLLFGGDDATTEQPGRVPDEAARVQNAERAGGVDERAQRSAAQGAAGGVRGDVSDRGGRGGGTERGDEAALGRLTAAQRREEYKRQNISSPARTLPEVRGPALATPQKMRGPAVVPPERWLGRMKDLRMPESLPAPTMKLDDDLAAMLIFPGQPEVAESTISALQQFDGAIIATPTGTGKTYTELAVVRQMQRMGQADKVLIITKNDSIIRSPRKGFKAIGKSTYAMDIQDVPKRGKAMGDGVYIGTYADLRSRADLMQPWDLVILDESAEAANWQVSAQGKAVAKLNDMAKKVVYASATPYASTVELGYMDKLGLWDKGKFAKWAGQFGVFTDKNGLLAGGHDPKKLLKLREQLIERGQFVTQEKSMKGFTAHFSQVPLTDAQHTEMRGIIKALNDAATYYDLRNNPQMAKAVRGNMATFVKSWLERQRLPETIEIAKKLIGQGWQVVIFSETKKKIDEMYGFLEEPDRAMNGALSAALPSLPGVYEELAKAFGEDKVANFSGQYSAAREAEKEAFDSGQKQIMFATYGAGGIGVSLHDTVGTRPRAAIYLGPPWSGKMFEQAMGRLWRYGTKSNVYSVFMVSNAAPETRMLLAKVAPRLESLRAAVEGVSDDPLVGRMRSLGSSREALTEYELGAADKTTAEDLAQLDRHILISNYKDLQAPDARAAMHKGMTYPGQVEDRPGVITLFQDDGTINLPDRFRTPEEVRGSRLNEEIAQGFVDGGALPGVGEALNDLEPGQRRMLADVIGPAVEEEMRSNSDADPSAVVRQAWQNQLTPILAARVAGDITLNPDPNGPAWNMRVPRGNYPPGEASPPDPQEAKDPAGFWAIMALTGRYNMRRIAARLGVPEVGVKIERMDRMYQVRHMNITGEYQDRFNRIIAENQITQKEARILNMVKEGKLPAPNTRIAHAAEELTKMTLDIAADFAKAGIVGQYFESGEPGQFDYDRQVNPRYLPHYFDYKEKITLTDPRTGQVEVFTLNDLLEGKKLPDIRRDRIIDAMEYATGMSRGEIESWLSTRRRRVPLAGNVERARQADLPFYRWDMRVWDQYFDQAGEILARTEVFGQNREKLDAALIPIRQRDNPEAAGEGVLKSIFNGILAKRPWDQQLGKWYSRIATAEIVSKMTWSAVKVPFHLAHSAVLLGNVNEVVRGVLGTAWDYKDAKERAILAGVLVDQQRAGMMMELAAGAGPANAMLKWTGFHKAYALDRIANNSAVQGWMERSALPKLIKKSRSADRIRRQLREQFLMDDKRIDAAIARGRWTQEDLSLGSAAMTNRTLFSTTPSELPPGWRGRPLDPNDSVGDSLMATVRLATVLKGFQFKTAAFLIEDAYKDGYKYIRSGGKEGNIRPFLYSTLVYPVIGEALRAATAAAKTLPAAVTGGNLSASPGGQYQKQFLDLIEHPTAAKLIQRYIDDWAWATGATMLSEIVDTFVFAPKNKRLAEYKKKQLVPDEVSWLLGPYADLYKSGAALLEALWDVGHGEGAKAWKATKGWAAEEFPAARPLIPLKTPPQPVRSR